MKMNLKVIIIYETDESKCALDLKDEPKAYVKPIVFAHL